MPKLPTSVAPESPDAAAQRARMAAVIKLRGSKGSASTVLTGGGGAAPVTAGTKTAYGQ